LSSLAVPTKKVTSLMPAPLSWARWAIRRRGWPSWGLLGEVDEGDAVGDLVVEDDDVIDAGGTTSLVLSREEPGVDEAFVRADGDAVEAGDPSRG